MAAGALFRDEDGRVLLVDPTYKPTWDLPGGAVEKEESPHAACRREVTEELGLDRPPGRVPVIDWVPSRPGHPEGLIVVYDGGVLMPGEVAAIMTQDDELAGYAFVEPDEVAERVSPLLARRIAACVDAVRAGTVISLEDGCPEQRGRRAGPGLAAVTLGQGSCPGSSGRSPGTAGLALAAGGQATPTWLGLSALGAGKAARAAKIWHLPAQGALGRLGR